jgi:diacylglycerol kinase
MLEGRIRSFRFAFSGIALMLRTQQNAWIHAAASLLVIGAAIGFRLAVAEWLWLILAMMAVWTAEALNTALELLADLASPDFHPLVGQAKDVAAGAVLISAIGSVAIAVLVLGPHCLALLRQGAGWP